MKTHDFIRVFGLTIHLTFKNPIVRMFLTIAPQKANVRRRLLDFDESPLCAVWPEVQNARRLLPARCHFDYAIELSGVGVLHVLDVSVKSLAPNFQRTYSLTGHQPQAL